MPAEEAILDQINSFMADWRAFLAVFQRGYTVSSSIFYSAFIPFSHYISTDLYTGADHSIFYNKLPWF
jgi:hypothetical protein